VDYLKPPLKFSVSSQVPSRYYSYIAVIDVCARVCESFGLRNCLTFFSLFFQISSHFVLGLNYIYIVIAVVLIFTIT